jgi:hypothetical protein
MYLPAVPQPVPAMLRAGPKLYWEGERYTKKRNKIKITLKHNTPAEYIAAPGNSFVYLIYLHVHV